MTGFFSKLIGPRPLPIGIDFGSDTVRIAQLGVSADTFTLLAAAQLDVPSTIRNDPAQKIAFFQQNIKSLLKGGHFKGSQVVLSVPASCVAIQHLRVPKMDENSLKKTLPHEARGKFPIDLGQAMIRHLIAGEVYQDQEPRLEVVCMAAPRQFVHDYLQTAAKCRLDVVGMNVEPTAIVDCFSNIWRRKTDQTQTIAFVDIGYTGTRLTIARAGQVLFARNISFGGQHLDRASADVLKLPVDEARRLRFKLAELLATVAEPTVSSTPAVSASPAPTASGVLIDQATPDEPDTSGSFAILGAAIAAHQKASASSPQSAQPKLPAPSQPAVAMTSQDSETQRNRAIEQACRDASSKLIDELIWSRRYHEATFPALPVNKIVFLGGESSHRWLCQHIARQLALPALVGDPLSRLRSSESIAAQSSSSAWAVALGLSLSALAAGSKQTLSAA